MDKPWKIVLLLLAIFATGATTGGLVAVKVCAKKAERGPSLPVEQWAPDRLRKLVQRLKLSPEQAERLRPILRRDMEDLGRIRAQSVEESRRIIERMEKDIMSQLTDEQKVEYAKIRRETDERFRRMKLERERARTEGGPPGERRPRPDRPPGGPESDPAKSPAPTPRPGGF